MCIYIYIYMSISISIYLHVHLQSYDSPMFVSHQKSHGHGRASAQSMRRVLNSSSLQRLKRSRDSMSSSPAMRPGWDPGGQIISCIRSWIWIWYDIYICVALCSYIYAYLYEIFAYIRLYGYNITNTIRYCRYNVCMPLCMHVCVSMWWNDHTCRYEHKKGSKGMKLIKWAWIK